MHEKKLVVSMGLAVVSHVYRDEFCVDTGLQELCEAAGDDVYQARAKIVGVQLLQRGTLYRQRIEKTRRRDGLD